MKKELVKKKIHGELPMLKKRFYVKTIGIFGSVARGEDTSQSDVDLLVDFKQTIGFFDFIRLENELSDLLGKKVDLVSSKALKPVIRKQVLKELFYV